MYEGRNMMYPPYFQGGFGYPPQYPFHQMYQMMDEKKYLSKNKKELTKENQSQVRVLEVRSIRSTESDLEVEVNIKRPTIPKRINLTNLRKRSN